MPKEYPKYYQYGYVFTAVLDHDRYISVIIMPDDCGAQISTGNKPAKALPYVTDDHLSNEKAFRYAYDKARALVAV
jgi:hypothetical protein